MNERRRTAVVTGASSGIGAATAIRLAEAGFEVIMGARRVDKMREIAGPIGATTIALDVRDRPRGERKQREYGDRNRHQPPPAEPGADTPPHHRSHLSRSAVKHSRAGFAAVVPEQAAGAPLTCRDPAATGLRANIDRPNEEVPG